MPATLETETARRQAILGTTQQTHSVEPLPSCLFRASACVSRSLIILPISVDTWSGPLTGVVSMNKESPPPPEILLTLYLYWIRSSSLGPH